MGGGLLQLTAIGAEDSYLTGNPQITFFKTIYRKYTNFSMEFISLDLKGPNSLSDLTNTLFKCKISRNADLINGVYFKMYLPNIFSSSDSTNTTNLKFKWIKNIGTSIISRVSIMIAGQEINKLYGEWLNVWSELNLTQDKRNQYNKLIGNVPDIYDPQHTPGNNGFYPSSSLNPSKITDPEDFTNDINPYRAPPSILAREIIVPLPLWFCNHSGQALPLIALQYSDIELEIELRPLIDLYTIIETNPESENYNTYVKPNPIRKEHRIGYYLSETLGSSDYSLFYTNKPSNTPEYQTLLATYNKLNENTTSNLSWDLMPSLDINYVFLEESERKRFSKVTHEYLIEQVNRFQFTGLVNEHTLDIPALHPTKQIILVSTRQDVTNRNDWTNYTNWKLENISPWSIGTENYKNILSQANNINNTAITMEKLLDPNNTIFANKGNINKYFKQNIIENITLLFNGVNRQSKRNYNFYNLVQPYSNLISNPKSGIYVYSFSLKDTADYQPKGTCNFSRLKKIQLAVKLLEAPRTGSEYDYRYNINVYTVNYNILRIMGGMGNLAFAS